MSSRSASLLVPSPSADPHPFPTQGPLEDYRSNFHALRRLLGQILEPFGLLVTDYQALRVAGKAPCRPGEISLYLAISPAATTELLDRLEGRGLLKRGRDPDDRRATSITLTSKGHKLLRESGEAYRRFLDQVTRDLSPRGREALREGSRELGEVLERRARELSR
jgi:MarR family transcriptional regulator, 2-MHQ and catechol-resistance regulon repressor